MISLVRIDDRKGIIKMAFNTKKKKNKATEEDMIRTMMSSLKDIYSNKSSDLYKSHGDITISSVYSKIEKMLADLRVIKKYPQNEGQSLRHLFNTLHRPIFKKMVTEYIHEPNERNTIFTCVYTVGYNVLIGELGRVYASTEATEEGIIYKPDKISRKNKLSGFIGAYNDSLEEKLDAYIREIYKPEPTQEAVSEIIAGVSQAVKYMTTALSRIFGRAKDINPIALINSILTHNYERKVEAFEDAYSMYIATKQSYDEYMDLPESQRIQKVESKYMKNLEKYNIKMQNLKAKIDHYDQRAEAEAEENLDNIPSDPSQDDDPLTEVEPSESNSTPSDEDADFDF